MSSVLIPSFSFAPRPREHELVHAEAVEGDRAGIADPPRPAAPQVVGVQHRRISDASRRPSRAERARCRRTSARTRRSCPGSRAAGRSTWAGRSRARSGSAAVLGRRRSHDLGPRQERLDAVGHRDRAGARAAAAVRLRERLVQVEVDDVEAHVAGPRDAHDRVQVRAVVVEGRADVVDDLRDLLDVAVEQPERVRVGEHQAGDVVVGGRAQLVEVDPALVVRPDLHDLVAGHRDRRRVGAVRGVGRQHLGAGARRDPRGRRASAAGRRARRASRRSAAATRAAGRRSRPAPPAGSHISSSAPCA